MTIIPISGSNSILGDYSRYAIVRLKDIEVVDNENATIDLEEDKTLFFNRKEGVLFYRNESLPYNYEILNEEAKYIKFRNNVRGDKIDITLIIPVIPANDYMNTIVKARNKGESRGICWGYRNCLAIGLTGKLAYYSIPYGGKAKRMTVTNHNIEVLGEYEWVAE